MGSLEEKETEGKSHKGLSAADGALGLTGSSHNLEVHFPNCR